MALTANDVITRATLLLNDKGNTVIGVAANTRWSVAELLEWVSDAQRQIILMHPNASNIIASVALAAGTRQHLPADGWLLLNITRNLTAGGAGTRAVREVKRDVMDAFNPNWHTDAANAVAWNFIYDVQDQDAFFVYPPNDGTGHVEVNYSRMPVQLTDVDQALVLDDIYLTPMVDYVCFRALSKDAEFAGGAALAQNFFAAFNAAMGARAEAEKDDSPDSTYSPPGQGNYVPKPGGR